MLCVRILQHAAKYGAHGLSFFARSKNPLTPISFVWSLHTKKAVFVRLAPLHPDIPIRSESKRGEGGVFVCTSRHMRN
jgi:hypothetical protein